MINISTIRAKGLEVDTTSHLDLFDVDVLELLLHLLDAGLHGVDGGLGVLEALRGVVGLLHVERLVAQVVALRLVLLLLLQHAQGLVAREEN